MSDEDTMDVDDEEIVHITDKGKGKAIENPGAGDDSLPWWVDWEMGANQLKGGEVSTPVSGWSCVS